MNEIKILSRPSESQPFVVLYKPSGLPSAPIKADDEQNAFSQAAKLFPKMLNVSGKKEIEHGLLHRLDTVTSGLLMIAFTQDFYDYMLEEQKNGRFLKYYKAECIDFEKNAELLKGFPPVNNELHKRLLQENTVTMSSYFRNYGAGQKEVRPVSLESNPAALKKIGKPVVYNTEIKLLDKEKLCIECKLTSGYRHQVRSHLAWLGFPIIGDSLYNYDEKKTQIRFSATKIEFNWNDKNFMFEKQ